MEVSGHFRTGIIQGDLQLWNHFGLLDQKANYRHLQGVF